MPSSSTRKLKFGFGKLVVPFAIAFLPDSRASVLPFRHAGATLPDADAQNDELRRIRGLDANLNRQLTQSLCRGRVQGGVDSNIEADNASAALDPAEKFRDGSLEASPQVLIV